MKVFTLITWNVNGLRAILRKNFYTFLSERKPDILCLQETKVYDTICPKIENFMYSFFNHCETKKGYSGTAVFSQIKPINVRCLDVDVNHPEGRIIVVEFSKFFLVNTYVPNSQSKLQRLAYRVQIWDQALRTLLKNLEKTKPVLWCGDLNVAHCPIDLENPECNHLNAGFTDEERQSFSEYLKAGFVDIFRTFHPNLSKQYTWWSYRMQARKRNIGWRIDYFLCSSSLLSFIASCEILPDVMGSDHAPVQLHLDKNCFKD